MVRRLDCLTVRALSEHGAAASCHAGSTAVATPAECQNVPRICPCLHFCLRARWASDRCHRSGPRKGLTMPREFSLAWSSHRVEIRPPPPKCSSARRRSCNSVQVDKRSLLLCRKRPGFSQALGADTASATSCLQSSFDIAESGSLWPAAQQSEEIGRDNVFRRCRVVCSNAQL
jgi:hypothetical protein